LESCRAENPWDLAATINLAELYYISGDLERAAQLAEDAAAIALWYPANKSVVTLFTNLSLYYLSIDPVRAIGFARQASELDPNDWQAYGNIAEACRVLGNRSGGAYLNEGVAACTRALTLNPTDLKLKVTYGGLLLELDRLSELAPYAIELINTYGGDELHVRFLLIRTFIACDQFEDAEAWLAPMRQYEALAPMIMQAESEMQRMSVRANRAPAALTEIDVTIVPDEGMRRDGAPLNVFLKLWTSASVHWPATSYRKSDWNTMDTILFCDRRTEMEKRTLLHLVTRHWTLARDLTPRDESHWRALHRLISAGPDSTPEH
jgi:tetratricopeptide (TPR) repeat protein